jgi:hypothetical protein
LQGARLRGTNLSGACLCGSDLKGADLRGSNVKSKQLICANVTCSTILPNGRKGAICASGQECCNGDCTFLIECDPTNCGRCGNQCGPTEFCCDSQCVAADCGVTEAFDPVACACAPAVCDPSCPPDQICKGPTGVTPDVACPCDVGGNGCANLNGQCCSYLQREVFQFGCGASNGGDAECEPGDGCIQRLSCEETCGGAGGGQPLIDQAHCSELRPCTGDCPSGFTCRESPCCGGSVCVPVCNVSRFP